MARLLDVNLLLALCDPGHASHEAAWDWFRPKLRQGWATCPLTENGFLRIISQPAYPGALPIKDAVAVLQKMRSARGHEFWPDEVSLLDATLFPGIEGVNSRQITDLYLLGLAVYRGGAFSTMDRNIPARCVDGGSEALEIVEDQ